MFALVVFGVAFAMRRDAPPRLWAAVTVNAITGGALVGWSIANVQVQSLGVGGWLQSLGYVGVALLGPPVVSGAAMRGTPLPSFSQLLGPAAQRLGDPFSRLMVAILIASTLMALLSALGLVFDPRYRDFPFAPLTAAIVPFFVHSITMPRPLGRHGAAEWIAGGILALSAPYIVLDESFANWQSLWLCGALVLLAFTLARVRDAQS
jgi:glucan 1,3-beta-glucosidase